MGPIAMSASQSPLSPIAANKTVCHGELGQPSEQEQLPEGKHYPRDR